jgi:chemotaxis protein MotB
MAGHGGGAWKVAYADFVTAMMAFFLVMWICSQDQKIKKSVADYFGDPLTIKQGLSKEPYRTGSMFEKLSTGTVPESVGVAVANGRNSYSSLRESNRLTKDVSDWLFSSQENFRYWKDRADVLRERNQLRTGESKKPEEAMKAATRQLAAELETKIGQTAAQGAKGLSADLIYGAITQVNWTELAEDLLAH